MPPAPRAVLASLLLVVSLAGGLAACRGPSAPPPFSDPAAAGRDGPGSDPLATPLPPGGTLTSVTGCALDYRIYPSGKPVRDGLVVLAHGFLRSKERMDGLARALAGAGLTTVTLDFCNTRLWDGRHFQNGLDMVALARSLGAGPVVYAGFSAGGLSALVAGSRDPAAVGIVALDLVDDRDLGLGLAAGLDKPLLGLMGEPTNCNAYGNGLPVFAAAPLGSYEGVAGAGHCDFESPTDGLCELVCTGPGAAEPRLRRWIIDATVAAVLRLLPP